jgi:hypothetical protein
MKTFAVVTVVLAAIPALAHHSNSAFDPEKGRCAGGSRSLMSPVLTQATPQ